MGIRAKQMLSSTFDSTQVNRLFAAQAIAGSKLANGGVGVDAIATAIAGNGLTGGGGAALDVEPDTTTGGGVSGLTVGANGIGISAPGNGLTGGAGTALAVDVDTETGGTVAPVSVTGNGVGLDVSTIDGTGLEASGATLRIAAPGDGLSGGAGSALVVDPDSTTGGDIVAVSVGVNGVGFNVAAIDGVGIEATGGGLLQLSVQGNGISGGGGSTLSVNADTGIAVSASGVAVDTASVVTFGASADWTFPNGVTAKGLFVTGTMIDANHVANKAYVDNAITGLQWLDPITCIDLIGNLGEVALEALTPGASDSYVVTAIDGDANLAGDVVIAVGDIVEYDGAAWVKIVSHSGGFPPAGTRMILNTAVALISPYTDATDDGKIVEFDGTSLSGLAGTVTVPTDGNSVLVVGNEGDTDPVDINNGYVFDGTVPTGSWTQFTGAGQINAGDGLTKSGNTLNVGAGTAITVAADSVSFDATGADGNGLLGTGSSLAVQPDTTTGGGVPGIAVGANGVGIATAAAGNGLAGGGGAALSVDSDTETGGSILGASVTANGVGIDVASLDGVGLEASTTTLRLSAQGNGIAGGAGSTLSVDVDTETGGNIAPASVTSNGVGLDVSVIAGTNLEADGAANLRIAASAAGGGLTGGGASVLAVGAGVGITVNANDVAVTPGDLISAGSAEIDGDQLDIDWNPSNYTPAVTPTEVSSVDHLTAHLYGIDQALGSAGGTQAQESITTEALTTDTALGETLTNAPSPAASLKLYLNGIMQVQQGTGTTGEPGFDAASSDYSLSGSTLTWLAGTGLAVDMETDDILVAAYEY